MQIVFKDSDIQNISLTPNEELNILRHITLSCVIVKANQYSDSYIARLTATKPDQLRFTII